LCLVVVLAAPVPVRARPHAARPARPAAPASSPWSLVRKPTSALPQVLGGYSAGCIDGAVPLPLAGNGFRVVHPERNRIFGHPDLIDMIVKLGVRLRMLGLPSLSVGDLGQPRGGPTPSGHASHQSGLDVDIWYVPPWLGRPATMVDTRHRRASPHFDEDVVQLLELAASDRRVDRVFVNPMLKRAVCERTSGAGDRSWVQKLRPWFGHDDHFHVRLLCPADSPTCIAPTPLPPGDGCEQLLAWLRPKPQPARRKAPSRFVSAKTPPLLPDDCHALLDATEPAESSTM
jgi:penicillin-insensitive murein endopeptidase